MAMPRAAVVNVMFMNRNSFSGTCETLKQLLENKVRTNQRHISVGQDESPKPILLCSLGICVLLAFIQIAGGFPEIIIGR
jgi:hypothetical protein